MAFIDTIDTIGCHVPRILSHQILSGVDDCSSSNIKDVIITPNIKYFWGAFLLVDISGFTALSTQVNAEALKIIINEYFTILIEQIDGFGGDVIKFAGDAIFVVWRINQSQRSLSDCVNSAISCAIDICSTCNNRVVQTKPGKAAKWLGVAPTLPRKFVTVLNVHSSISAGLIGGVDVGFLGRWEYFLLGKPITDAGSSIDCARAGEFVLTKSAFECLNDLDRTCFHFQGNATDSYLFTTSMSSHIELKKAQRKVGSFSAFLTECLAASSAFNGLEGRDEDTIRTVFSDLLSRALAGHIHEAVRSSIGIEQSININGGALRRFIGSAPAFTSSEIFGAEIRKIVTIFIHVSMDLSTSVGDEEKCDVAAAVNSNSDDAAGVKEAKLSSCGGHISEGSSTIVTSTSTSTSTPFVIRSPQQQQNDTQLLGRLQSCMEVFTTAFQENGGQLRQFILDDKGLVCMGTFGLRRSVSVDNSTSAITCAKVIMSQLQAMDLKARMGIATGKAFCGLIGSSSRHEFGVMGRSVNLAARLMGASKMGSITCDSATREEDRHHSYVSLAEVKAKGYANLVATFRPVAVATFRPVAVSSEGRPPVSPSDDKTGPKFAAIESSRSASYFARGDELTEVLSYLDTPLPIPDSHPDAATARVVAVYAERGLGKCFFAKMLSSRLVEMNKVVAVVTAKATAGGSIAQFDVWQQIFASMFSWIDSRQPPIFSPLSPLSPLVRKAGSSAVCSDAVASPSPRSSLVQPHIVSSPTPSRLRRLSSHHLPHFQKYSTKENVKIGQAKEDDSLILGSSALTAVLKSQSHYSSNSHSTSTSTSQYGSKSGSTIDESDQFVRIVGSVLFPETISVDGLDDLNESSASLLNMTVAALTRLLQMTVDFMLRWEVMSSQGRNAESSEAVLIVIEEIHNMDNSSMAVLEQVWNQGRGFTVVCCCTSSAVTSTVQPESASIMTSFVSLERITRRSGGSYNFHQQQEHSSSRSTERQRQHPVPLLFGEAQVGSMPTATSTTLSTQTKLASMLLSDTERSFQLYFGAFSKAATNKLVLSMLQQHYPESNEESIHRGVSRKSRSDPLHGSFFDLIYATTNGNPSFAAEITTAAVARSANLKDLPASLKEILVSFRSNKLDDMVLYQLDSLSPASQLVLKVASVAGIDDASFSSQMLLELITAFQQSDSTINTVSTTEAGGEAGAGGGAGPSLEFTAQTLTAMLQEILTKTTILSVIETSGEKPDSGVAHEATADAEIDSRRHRIHAGTELYFTSPERQAVIYDLMLMKQLHLLHNQVAAYLERVAINDRWNCTQAAFWNEVGQHWEKASQWSKALACYYEAAVILDKRGVLMEAKLFSCKAYNMFQSMRQEGGIRSSCVFVWSQEEQKCIQIFNVGNGSPSPRLNGLLTPMNSVPTSPRIDAAGNNIPPTHFAIGAEAGPSRDNVGRRGGTTTNEPAYMRQLLLSELAGSDKTMDFKSLYLLFKGDLLALKVSVMMLIKLFQCFITSMDDPSVTTNVLNEALEIILLASPSVARSMVGKRLPVAFDSGHGLLRQLHAGLVLGSSSGGDKGHIDFGVNNPGARSQTVDDSMHAGAVAQSVGVGATVMECRPSSCCRLEDFFLRDSTVIFRVLSGLGMQYVIRAVHTDTTGAQFEVFVETYLRLAEEIGDHVHILRAMTFLVWKNNHCNKYSEAILWAERLRSLYDYDLHSNSIIELFGSERVLQALAVSVLHRVLVGDFVTASELCLYVQSKLSLTKRLHTIAMTTMTIVSAFLLMEMYNEAFAAFIAYFKVEVASGSHSLLFKYNLVKFYSLLQLSDFPRNDGMRLLEVSNTADIWKDIACMVREPVKFSHQDTPPRGANNRRRSAGSAAVPEDGAHTMGLINPVLTERSQPVVVQEIYGFSFDFAKAIVCFDAAKTIILTASTSSTSSTASAAAAATITTTAATAAATAAVSPEEGKESDDKAAVCAAVEELHLSGRRSVLDLCTCGLRFISESLAAGSALDDASIHTLHCLWLRAEIAAFMATLALTPDIRAQLDSFSIDITSGKCVRCQGVTDVDVGAHVAMDGSRDILSSPAQRVDEAGVTSNTPEGATFKREGERGRREEAPGGSHAIFPSSPKPVENEADIEVVKAAVIIPPSPHRMDSRSAAAESDSFYAKANLLSLFASLLDDDPIAENESFDVLAAAVTIAAVPPASASDASSYDGKQQIEQQQQQQQHPQQQIFLRAAASALQQCEEIGRRTGSPTVLLKTGLLYERLGLPTVVGKALVLEAMDIVRISMEPSGTQQRSFVNVEPRLLTPLTSQPHSSGGCFFFKEVGSLFSSSQLISHAKNLVQSTLPSSA